MKKHEREILVAEGRNLQNRKPGSDRGLTITGNLQSGSQRARGRLKRIRVIRAISAADGRSSSPAGPDQGKAFDALAILEDTWRLADDPPVFGRIEFNSCGSFTYVGASPGQRILQRSGMMCITNQRPCRVIGPA